MDSLQSAPEVVQTRGAKKNATKGKDTVRCRIISHPWSDDEIVCLISAVTRHPALWDFNSAEYKQSKRMVWRQVGLLLYFPYRF